MLNWCLLFQEQIKRGGGGPKGAQQRIVNGNVQMLAESDSQISAIKVWIFRESEPAKLCQDKQGRQELPVTLGYYEGFQVG